MTVVAMLLALYNDDLSPTQRRLATAAVALAVATGLLLGPRPVQWRPVLMALLWPGSAFLSALKIRQGLQQESALLATELTEADEDEVRKSFVDGRSSVIELVSEARFRAWRLFGDVGDELPPTLRAEAQRRLQEVDKRLEALQCARG